MAYQGFGEGLDADAQGPRLLAAQLPELLLATSCSKNFGLYRERTYAISAARRQPGAGRRRRVGAADRRAQHLLDATRAPRPRWLRAS